MSAAPGARAEGSRFRAPWDRTVKVITALFVGLLSGLAIFFVYQGMHLTFRHSGAAVAMFVASGLCLSLLVLAALLAPRGYILGPEGVTILRRWSNLTFPLDAIGGVELDEQGEVFRKAIRIGAMGGGFGFWGYFAKTDFGLYTAYATRRTGLVILRRTRGEPVVITPEDPERFVEMLRQELGRGGSTL